MKHPRAKRRATLLIAALTAAGCAAIPAQMPPPVRPDVLQTANAADYQLLADYSFPAPIDTVVASSTRNETWFSVDHVTDGFLTSAWGPAATDDSPFLIFHLARTVSVDAVGLKLSLGRFSSTGNHRVSVAVDVSTDGGATWTNVHPDFRPAETTLDSTTFPAVDANAVRLRFSPVGDADLHDLLVCEAHVIDPITPNTQPSSTPPSDTPSTPTPDPQASTPTNDASPQATSTPSGDTPSSQPTATPMPPTPTPDTASACGVFSAYSPGSLGANPRGTNRAKAMYANWNTFVPGSTDADGNGYDDLVVGNGPYTLTFTGPEAITAFLPSGGTISALTQSHVDPIGTTEAGNLAGQTVTLKLNMLMSGLTTLRAPGEVDNLGNLVVASGAFAGVTLEQILDDAERLLAGESPATVLTGSQTLAELYAIAAKTNRDFEPFAAPDPAFFLCP